MRMFYGWKMVAAGGGLQFLQAGLLHQGFGTYLAVLNEERGWSKTALAGAATLQPMEAAFLGPVLGWAMDRFGPQGMIRIGIVVFGLGFMALSQIDSLAGFYGAFLIIALGSSLCGFFPLNVAIIHWFERLRARALSSLSLGLALGGLFVPVVAWSMQTWGWRTTAFVSGLLVIAIGFPLARVIRRRPGITARRSTACRARRRRRPIRPRGPCPHGASSPCARRFPPVRSGCSRSGMALRSSWCSGSMCMRSPS